jgi:FkbM family methyltransferase
MQLLKRLTHRPEVIWLARACGLREFLRKCYFRWARPADGILPLELAGRNAQFYVHTPEELRMLGKAETGYWERDIMEILARDVQTGDVAYDIGSNIGLYTVLLSKAVGNHGQVIAYEPARQSYEILRDNLTLNAVTNVRTFQVALGDHRGEEKLYFSDADRVFACLTRPRSPTMTHQIVQVVEGDKFREAENLPIPRVVKIDVEGYEYAVIRGLRRTLSNPACQLVACEVHPTLLPDGLKPEQVHDLLKSLGFSCIKSQPRKDTYHVIATKARP